MGKITNLFAGIFILTVGFFVEEVYQTLVEGQEIIEFLPFDLETVVTNTRFVILGIGALLIIIALIQFIVSAFTKDKEGKITGKINHPDRDNRDKDKDRKFPKPERRDGSQEKRGRSSINKERSSEKGGDNVEKHEKNSDRYRKRWERR